MASFLQSLKTVNLDEFKLMKKAIALSFRCVDLNMKHNPRTSEAICYISNMFEDDLNLAVTLIFRQADCSRRHFVLNIG